MFKSLHPTLAYRNTSFKNETRMVDILIFWASPVPLLVAKFAGYVGKELCTLPRLC